MKKALDQTIRDLKREVNKKVLKVPGVEQKVLDATSNEPWGPHGAHLADIAQATRNYHEYQMIMAILWKRINDTGKNWRHVYKGLTVLEYLVAHGSERVIDDIKEHAYQIMALHDFQYIDSGGRDQGNNVRKKSHSLVVLVNDKERVLEVREKANANREKFRNTSSTGGMHRVGSYSSTGGYGDRQDDDRYGYKDDDRNGYGRENDDRYGRGVDSYSRDGDRYGRDSDDRYGRDGYRDDDHRGRSQSTDEYQYGSRSRSSDRAYDDEGRYSSRSSGARADDPSQDEGRLERKFSEPNIAPPPYEEAVSDSRSPVHDERETAEAPTAKASSPTGSTSQAPEIHMAGTAASPTNQEFGGFDEFDPRGPFSAAPPTANNGDMDFLGSLSNSFSSDALAVMPMTTTTSEADLPINSGSAQTFVPLASASTVLNQPVQDPFGDSPFKATETTDNIPDHTHNATSASNFQPSGMGLSSQPFQQGAPKMESVPSFDFGDTFSGSAYTPDVANNNLQLALTDPSVSNQNIDVLADILPPSGSTAPQVSQAGFSAPGGPFGQQPNNVHGNFLPQGGYTTPAASQGPFYTPPVQPVQQNSNAYGNLHPQSGHMDQVAPQFVQQNSNAYGNLNPQSGHTAPVAVQPVQQNNNAYGNLNPQSGHTAPVAVQPVQQNNNAYGNLQPQSSYTAPIASYEAPVTTSANARPPKKFEPKSSVWSDTLSKGLVNFNISGPKTNPLADIGVDFDSLNRREKREKPASTTAVASTISMGKAMGSGSGIGRAGANSLAPPSNPGMGTNMGMASRPGMGMGMGMAGGPGMGMVGNPSMGMGMAGNGGMGMNMGGYGGMNQPMGMNNMGMGMGMNNMGMGMNMPPGGQMRPPMPGQNMPGYNPMMGPGGYPQQQYGHR